MVPELAEGTGPAGGAAFARSEYAADRLKVSSVREAQLELQRVYDLPERFEFLHGATKRWCTLAWSRGFRIGISYEGSTVQRSSVSGGLSRPKSGASLLSRR